MSVTLESPATRRPIAGSGPGPSTARTGPTRPAGLPQPTRPARLTQPTRPAGLTPPRVLSPTPRRSADRPAGVAARSVADSCARPLGADAHSSAIHLTRRGWFLLLAAAVVLAGALLGVGHVVAAGRAAPVVAPAPAQVVVEPGDTLWSIASAAAPQRDPREVVFDIRRRNHLGSAALVPGQVLQLS